MPPFTSAAPGARHPEHSANDLNNKEAPCLPYAFAANGWPTTSLMENLWQWCVLAIALQQLLGMNPAATNQWTLDLHIVFEAKHLRRSHAWRESPQKPSDGFDQ